MILRLGLSVWLNWLVSAGTILTAYLLLPFNLDRLGNGAYGTWLLVNSITGYLALLALGAPMATLRFVAQFAAQDDTDQLNQALGTFAGLYLAMASAAVLVGGILLIGFEAVYLIPEGLAFEAKVAFGAIILCVAIGFIQQLPYGVMAAYHDFGIRSGLMGGALLVRLVTNLVIIAYWPSLIGLACVNLVVALFEALSGWIVLRRRYPALSVRLSRFSFDMLRRVFSFGLFVVLLNFGFHLSFQTDALVIGKFLPVGDIPFYTIPNSLMLCILELVGAAAVVVMPRATALHESGGPTALASLYLKWSKITLCLGLAVGCVVLVFGPRILGLWLGPEFEGPGGVVMRILVLPLLVYLPARAVAQAIAMGIGRPAAPSLALVAAGVLNVVLSVWWVVPFGLQGVAWGTAIPTLLLGMFMVHHTCRITGLEVTEFLRHVVLRPVIGAVAGLCLSFLLYHALDPDGLGELVACCTLLGMAMLWIATHFVFADDPHLDLKAELALIIGKARRALGAA